MIKNLHKFSFCLIFFLALMSIGAVAQQKMTVTITVRDAKSTVTLPGVSVLIKGATTGGQTDAKGVLSLQATPGSVLTFSYIGYKEQMQTVGNETYINIALEPNPETLKEVVVVGYGKQSRSTLAGSTSTIKASSFQDNVVNTFEQAIQGRATGVQVTEASGEPGGDIVFRIRGNNSLSGSNQPLIVIDGVPQPTYTEGGAQGITGAYQQNGNFGINPNDIANIEILKDASATAIYGSRGANGVVLITTKSGALNSSKIEFSNKSTYGVPGGIFRMMNGREYADIRNQNSALNGNGVEFDIDTVNTSTDWFKAITRKNIRQDYNLNVSGGGAKSTYYVSADYLSDRGILLGSSNKKGSLLVNLNNTINSWYSNKVQISASRAYTNRAITASKAFPSQDGPVIDAARATPFFPIDYTGSDGGGSGITNSPFNNPVIELTTKTDIVKNDFLNANIENDFQLMPGLKLVANLNATNVSSNRQVFYPPNTGPGTFTNGQASVGQATTYAYNVNAFLNYDKTFKGGHELNATFGGEYNLAQVHILNTAASGFDVSLLGDDNLGIAQAQAISSYRENRVIQSGFLRGNYNYKHKYVFNGSIRLDGASAFASNKKFGWFPSAGIAYNVTEEEFMKPLTAISNLKLRASYGVTGSQAISPYSSLANFNTAFYQLGYPVTSVTSIYPTSLGNANLTWESTSSFDAGIDLSMFNSRLNLTIDYYNKVTSNLLQPRTIPAQSGFTTIIDNYGKMGNKGIEIGISGDIVRGTKFRYTTGINFTHNINKLINLGTRTDPQYISLGGGLQGGISNVLIPGQPIGLFYGYKVVRLSQTSDFTGGTPNFPYYGAASDQVPGGWILEDLNHDGKIDINDRQVLGNATPKFIAGWTNDFSYKKFSLSILVTASYGNDMLDMTRYYLNSGIINNSGILFNQTQDWYNNRWTASNPTTNILYPGLQKRLGTQDITSAMVEKGSYARLKNLTLSYSFNSFKNVLKNPRIFFTGTNLITITNYKGLNPDISSYGQSLLQQGIDYGSYPLMRTYTIGLSSSF